LHQGFGWTFTEKTTQEGREELQGLKGKSSSRGETEESSEDSFKKKSFGSSSDRKKTFFGTAGKKKF